MANDADLQAAHRHSANHRAEVLASPSCGCFYCHAVFHPSEIQDWIDVGADGIGGTALCPRCGIDAVIGSSAGMVLDERFLSQMHEHWFERAHPIDQEGTAGTSLPPSGPEAARDKARRASLRALTQATEAAGGYDAERK